ncbi:hypothetical protein F5X99DRAFT_385086 [Biscogniauxia marginata]|nr:hypothetical protein F5X99DRAFT_385086 [Biscogniauxia marginata]
MPKLGLGRRRRRRKLKKRTKLEFLFTYIPRIDLWTYSIFKPPPMNDDTPAFFRLNFFFFAFVVCFYHHIFDCLLSRLIPTHLPTYLTCFMEIRSIVSIRLSLLPIILE